MYIKKKRKSTSALLQSTALTDNLTGDTFHLIPYDGPGAAPGIRQDTCVCIEGWYSSGMIQEGVME